MGIDKQELDEQIDHHQELLQILRRRLRVQERKKAEYGIDVPAQVATDILTLNEQIAEHEDKLARLKSVAAEDKVPLAEVEYRALLAQAWDTPSGRPTFTGAAKLDYDRLRLGVPSERAEELEYEVRVAMAMQKFNELPQHLFTYKVSGYAAGGGKMPPVSYTTVYLPLVNNTEGLVLLGRAVRLHAETALQLLNHRIPRQHPFNVEAFAKNFLGVNNVWPGQEDDALLNRFLIDFKAALKGSPPADTAPDTQ